MGINYLPEESASSVHHPAGVFTIENETSAVRGPVEEVTVLFYLKEGRTTWVENSVYYCLLDYDYFRCWRRGRT